AARGRGRRAVDRRWLRGPRRSREDGAGAGHAPAGATRGDRLLRARGFHARGDRRPATRVHPGGEVAPGARPGAAAPPLRDQGAGPRIRCEGVVMNRIDSDLRALADETARQLPRLDDTARALARGRQGGSMRIVKKLAIAVVLVGAVLVCPVPYSRVVGYDLAVRAADGRATTVHLATRDAGRAERR